MTGILNKPEKWIEGVVERIQRNEIREGIGRNKQVGIVFV